MKLCYYIAGDENILIPALVTLASVNRFNKVDSYIFTDNPNVSDELLKIIEKYEIKLINNEILSQFFINFEFSVFGRWPKHVWLNYIIPEYLKKLNYDYAIKLDYDILCVNKPNIECILPSYEEVMSIALRFPLKFIEFKETDIKLSDLYPINEFKTLNAGVICINIHSYIDNKIIEKLHSIYRSIVQYKATEYVEQLSLALLQPELAHDFKDLPLQYNFRTAFSRTPKNVTFIHFNTSFKPWHNLKNDSISSDTFRTLLLRNYWLDFADEIGLHDLIYTKFKIKRYDLIDICRVFDNSRVNFN